MDGDQRKRGMFCRLLYFTVSSLGCHVGVRKTGYKYKKEVQTFVKIPSAVKHCAAPQRCYTNIFHDNSNNNQNSSFPPGPTYGPQDAERTNRAVCIPNQRLNLQSETQGEFVNSQSDHRTLDYRNGKVQDPLEGKKRGEGIKRNTSSFSSCRGQGGGAAASLKSEKQRLF